MLVGSRVRSLDLVNNCYDYYSRNHLSYSDSLYWLVESADDGDIFLFPIESLQEVSKIEEYLYF